MVLMSMVALCPGLRLRQGRGDGSGGARREPGGELEADRGGLGDLGGEGLEGLGGELTEAGARADVVFVEADVQRLAALDGDAGRVVALSPVAVRVTLRSLPCNLVRSVAETSLIDSSENSIRAFFCSCSGGASAPISSHSRACWFWVGFLVSGPNDLPSSVLIV